ncbi:MAG: AMP-binding protein, partial [Pseudomonadota bacterium]
MKFVAHPENSPYQQGLDRNAANYAPLSPLRFLERAADVYPDRLAVVHGSYRADYRTLRERSRRLASALVKHGVKPGDTVAAMLPNTPPMLEAHHGVPMAGAVLNSLNVRLEAETIAYILDHGEAKVLLTDTEFSPVIEEALAMANADPIVIDVVDMEEGALGDRLGDISYEQLLEEGNP